MNNDLSYSFLNSTCNIFFFTSSVAKPLKHLPLSVENVQFAKICLFVQGNKKYAEEVNPFNE